MTVITRSNINEIVGFWKFTESSPEITLEFKKSTNDEYIVLINGLQGTYEYTGDKYQIIDQAKSVFESLQLIDYNASTDTLQIDNKTFTRVNAVSNIQSFLSNVQISAIKSKQNVNQEYIESFKSYFTDNTDGDTHIPKTLSFTLNNDQQVVIPTASMVHHSQFNIEEMTVDSSVKETDSDTPQQGNEKISIKLTSTKPPETIQRLIDRMSFI